MAISTHWIDFHNWVTLGLSLGCKLRLVLKLSFLSLFVDELELESVYSSMAATPLRLFCAVFFFFFGVNWDQIFFSVCSLPQPYAGGWRLILTQISRVTDNFEMTLIYRWVPVNPNKQHQVLNCIQNSPKLNTWEIRFPENFGKNRDQTVSLMYQAGNTPGVLRPLSRKKNAATHS